MALKYMDWYYKQDDRKIGPVSETEVSNLIQQGVIRADTPVWNDIIGKWMCYAEAKTCMAEPKHLSIALNTHIHAQITTGHTPNAGESSEHSSTGCVHPDKNALTIHSNVRGLSLVFNGLSLVVALWCLFSKIPSTVAIWICLSTPAAALISVYWVTRHPEEQKFPIKPYQILFAIIAPTMVLFQRMYQNYPMVSYTPAWTLAVILGTFISYCIFTLPIEINMLRFYQNKWKPGAILLTPILSLLYGYELVVGINCMLNFSATPTQYISTVISKDFIRTINYDSLAPNSIRYVVQIAPWGSVHDVRKITIRHALYIQLQPLSVIVVDLRNGVLGIPWYQVRLKSTPTPP